MRIIVLSDQVLQLLTAYIDGELSERQRDDVLRLLHKSSEARDMMLQLQENAHKLKQLPHHDVDPCMKDQILQAIVEQLAQPKTPAPKRGARRRWLPFVAAGLAACLLIGTIGVVYWQAMSNRKDDFKFVVPERPKQPEFKFAPNVKPPELVQDKTRKLPVDDMIAGAFGGFAEPVHVRNIRFDEFGKQDVAEQFSREVNDLRIVELDVTVKNDRQAVDRLKNVFKYYGISIVGDAGAGKASDGPRTEYLVYAENLNSDEMVKLMRELGESYVISPNGNNQQTVSSPYEKVAVGSITNQDKGTLAKSLGFDPTKVSPPENGNVRPDAKRVAVLLPANGVGAPSPELKRFVNERLPLQSGTVQVLIKIRQQ